jgi:hypothetical protein
MAADRDHQGNSPQRKQRLHSCILFKLGQHAFARMVTGHRRA